MHKHTRGGGMKSICVTVEHRLPDKPDEHDHCNEPVCLYVYAFPWVCGSVCVCVCSLKNEACTVPEQKSVMHP